MSLNGTHPASVVGSHAVLRPLTWSSCCARATHAPAPALFSAIAMAGFKPDGRKKFISAAETQGTLLTAPQGAGPEPTKGGPPDAPEVTSPRATCQFLTKRSPRGVLAFIGRFRWRPPVELYAQLNEK